MPASSAAAARNRRRSGAAPASASSPLGGRASRTSAAIATAPTATARPPRSHAPGTAGASQAPSVAISSRNVAPSPPLSPKLRTSPASAAERSTHSVCTTTEGAAATAARRSRSRRLPPRAYAHSATAPVDATAA